MAIKPFLLMAALLGLHSVAKAEVCTTLQGCLEKFPAVATTGPGDSSRHAEDSTRKHRDRRRFHKVGQSKLRVMPTPTALCTLCPFSPHSVVYQFADTE